MSASLGPKLFELTRDEVAAMIAVNVSSLAECVAKLEVAVAEEDNDRLKPDLEKWLALLRRDLEESRFMQEHLSDTPVHHLTGTELIGIGRNFREVFVDVGKLRMATPPSAGEMAERRQAATIAAVPRASVPDFLVGARGR